MTAAYSHCRLRSEEVSKNLLAQQPIGIAPDVATGP